jgi:nuclear migration protein JNM1
VDEATSQPRKSNRAATDKNANDPAELLKGVHDLRARLEKMGTAKDGRVRLVDAVVTGPVLRHTTGSSHTTHPHGGSFVGTPLSPTSGIHSPGLHRREGSLHRRENSFGGGSQGASAPTQTSNEPDPGIAKLDSRVGELEKLIGSSSAALDESSPLPPPLLPMLTRLNSQLTILTQPRTIDSISRRLKLLLTDLDRVATQNAAANALAPGGQSTGMGHNRGTSTAGPVAAPPPSGGSHATSTIHDQLTPILQRLAPHLPTLPHILARLRTLSSLHAAASDFQRGMEQVSIIDIFIETLTPPLTSSASSIT